MRRTRLGELVGRLRGGGLDPTPEEVADAVWLAQWLPRGPRPAASAAPEPGDPAHPPPDGEHDPGTDARPPATSDPDPGSDPDLAGSDPDSGPDPGPGSGSGERPTESTSPAAASGTVQLYMPGGRAHPDSAPGGPAFPVRAPAAAALPGLLGLQRALQPLTRYAAGPARPGEGVIDEAATAERGAMTGVITPVLRAARRQRAEMQLLMDTGPAMAVWGRMVEELRQACQQSGVFRDVQVHQLYDTGDGPPLIATTSGPGRRTRLRSADQFHDPTGRRLTLVVSDCVGPLWQRGSAQRLLNGWPRTAPLAVVQPLPPRLWARTALPAERGLLTHGPDVGGRTDFLPYEEPWEPRDPRERPVPVLQPTPEAFAAWARLLSTPGGAAERAWAAWTSPDGPTASGVPPAPAPPDGRGDEELLRAFTASASPGAVQLAVHLAAAPLTLPVMQLVQRAMLPDTGPTELAEVLLGGLLRQLPGTEAQPCFVYPRRVQELLLGSLDRDAAGLVLKHCSAFVERHFGKGTRNFAALAAARLAGEPGPHTGDGTERAAASGGVDSELFARIPARVLRFYQPDLVLPGPLEQAERLLRQWHEQGDPSVLSQAGELAARALREAGEGEAAGGAADEPTRTARAATVLGRVLRAEAGTAAVRDTDRRAELLHQAAAVLAQAGDAAPRGGPEHLDAALELASVLHELWHATRHAGHLETALEALEAPELEAPEAPEAPAVPEGAADDRPAHPRGALRLLRGRLLLAQGRAAAAVPELRAATDPSATEGDSSGAARCAALLDLADALCQSGADPAETAAALTAAERAADDDRVLRLRALAAQGAFHDGAGDGESADRAYEQAARTAPRDSPGRGRILMVWGESLLRRASRPDGAATVGRAESVLREALAELPARSPHRGRLQGLVGSALAQRFRHLGFLPDLFESRHLLRQVVRGSAEARVRAEAWLQLARVALELWRRTGTPVRADALHAYRQAERDAREACPAAPGSVTAARALHGQGAVLALMGQRDAALARYRAAGDGWRLLTGHLSELDWSDVELTRQRMADAAVAAAAPEHRAQWSDEDWSRAFPPWWPWGEGG
ncbi:SAV_2336 N-terminal domain-related protein [Streptomyces sp. O3]